MKKLKLPNEKQEKELCDIILSGGKLHEKVVNYLREHNLSIMTRDKRYCPKILIRQLIDKYELNKERHIDLYDCLYPLTQQEFDVIVGGLLGDTWIGKPDQAKNASGSFTHKLEHMEYVQYKYNLIKRRCSEVAIHNKFDKRTKRYYQQAFCKIASSEILNPIQQAFYPNGKKIVPEELINKLSPLGIAIWFMDDGASDGHGYKFSVDCFSKDDIEKLSRLLSNKFNIKNTIQINSNKTIHICAQSIKDFKNLVEPHMCNCMKYKLQIYKKVKGIFQRVNVE